MTERRMQQLCFIQVNGLIAQAISNRSMLHARLQEDDHEERENRCLVTNVHHPSLVPDTDGAGAFGHRPECDPILERDHLIENVSVGRIVEDQLTVSIRVFSHSCLPRLQVLDGCHRRTECSDRPQGPCRDITTVRP